MPPTRIGSQFPQPGLIARLSVRVVTAVIGSVLLWVVLPPFARAEAGSTHDWPGATHANDQCIKLAKSKAVLRDVEGNPLRNTESTEITIKGNAKSETCKASSESGVQITGIEAIKTGSGLTLYYSWSGLSNTSQESGFIASTELASTPTNVRSDSGENHITHELNGEPASLPTGEPHYRINSTAIPLSQGYFGGSKWYTYAPYGLPGCCDSHFSLMTWSWIDVSGGGITRANVAEGALFYPSTVPLKRLTSVNERHEPNGEVTAIYGKVSSGSQTIWGWMVSRANYYIPGSESGCRSHMEYVAGGSPIAGLLCESPSSPTEAVARPVVTPSGELLTVAADANHELLQFYRTAGGEWKVYDVTANVVGNPTVEGDAVPIVTPGGELLVTAVDTNKELLSFSRSSSGEWSLYNITANVSGNPTVSGPADPIVTSNGELIVFAANTNKELVSFSRSSGGEWKVYNITSAVSGNPDITGAPTPIVTSNGELIVFAADTNKELVSFYRTSGGEWKVYNITEAVAGNPDILGVPNPIMTSSGELLVFAADASSELVSFYRTTGGEWKIYNITAAVPGNPRVEDMPVSITPTGELLVMDADIGKELVNFYRTSGGEWRVYNITAAVPGDPLL
jgi:hypothetical protein